MERIILIDADVVSHFITAGKENSLQEIFPCNPIYILDKVYAELQQWPAACIRSTLNLLLSNNIIRLMDFPENDNNIRREYFYIKSVLFKGDGESACLAVARYNKNILASSNLKDIKSYCQMHRIDYLTTMDFLCEALRTGLFSMQDCNCFISKVLAAGSKLPIQTMQGYLCRNIGFLQEG